MEPKCIPATARVVKIHIANRANHEKNCTHAKRRMVRGIARRSSTICASMCVPGNSRDTPSSSPYAAQSPASTYSILSPRCQAMAAASTAPNASQAALCNQGGGPATAVARCAAGGSASAKPASSAGEYSRVLNTVQQIAPSSTTAPK
ncbi:hypothetical protein D3C72_1366480 [compost metagenome]